KPAKKQNDVLAAALADARRQAGSSAAKALADLEKMQRRQGVGGGAGDGDGPGGGGIYDVYVAQVILAVQPNWSMPVYSRSNMVVQVRIQLDRHGKVLDCKVEKSSGRPEFDASAVNAVVRTGMLPAPPTPAQQDLLISFNSQQMLGR
ncbi:MAG: cell envelope integrity protein TolA, partial [Mailhella sp.]|nr:cell envelope integrity protein TolA [Mailhella sp.]